MTLEESDALLRQALEELAASERTLLVLELREPAEDRWSSPYQSRLALARRQRHNARAAVRSLILRGVTLRLEAREAARRTRALQAAAAALPPEAAQVDLFTVQTAGSMRPPARVLAQ